MTENIKSFVRRLMPRKPRPHRILGGHLRGRSIVTSWFDYPAAILGYTEGPLLDWFERNVQPGETWLDIGAHYGYTAIALCNLVGNTGRVFAFEPMLSTAGCLAQTRALNRFANLTIVPFGLGAPSTLSLQNLPVVRGMVDSTLGGGNWLETILVARLDWLWLQICGEQARIDGVKMDVQGMEIDVLRGMRDTLAEQHPKLVIEIHCGVNRSELLALIESMGYSRSAKPVEPTQGEVEPRYVDDRSYSFTAQ